MARPERIELEVLAEPGVGGPVNVFRLRDKTVQVGGPFAGAVQIEGSLNGEDFAPIGAPMNAPGFVLVPMTIALVRVRTVEAVSGEPRVTVGGFNYRAM